jgi:hypothetical protein
MTNWLSIASFSDRMSAEAIAELLRGEGIPVYISSNEYVPGLGTNFSVAVAADQSRRARWFLQQSHVSEQELTYLAIGEAAAVGVESPSPESSQDTRGEAGRSPTPDASAEAHTDPSAKASQDLRAKANHELGPASRAIAGNGPGHT